MISDFKLNKDFFLLGGCDLEFVSSLVFSLRPFLSACIVVWVDVMFSSLPTPCSHCKLLPHAVSLLALFLNATSWAQKGPFLHRHFFLLFSYFWWTTPIILLSNYPRLCSFAPVSPPSRLHRRPSPTTMAQVYEKVRSPRPLKLACLDPIREPPIRVNTQTYIFALALSHDAQ